MSNFDQQFFRPLAEAERAEEAWETYVTMFGEAAEEEIEFMREEGCVNIPSFEDMVYLLARKARNNKF
jgi:hypothetical protein